MGPQYVLDGGLCFSAFHGEKELLSRRYAQCTQSMSQGSMEMQWSFLMAIRANPMTHQRRTKGQGGATITFTESMHLTMRKDQFLANKENKQRFINMLSTLPPTSAAAKFHSLRVYY